MAMSLTREGYAESFIKEFWRTKIRSVGIHVWVYAADLPEYDVSPILDQIFSDVSYAGFDGVETMEQPLRSSVYTK